MNFFFLHFLEKFSTKIQLANLGKYFRNHLPTSRSHSPLVNRQVLMNILHLFGEHNAVYHSDTLAQINVYMKLHLNINVPFPQYPKIKPTPSVTQHARHMRDKVSTNNL